MNLRDVYRLDADAVIIAEVFSKKTQATPKAVLDVCRCRLAAYDRAARGEGAVINSAKRKRLEAQGWRVGTTREFLGLSVEEAALVETKLRLSQGLRERRAKLALSQAAVAKRLRSSQSQ